MDEQRKSVIRLEEAAALPVEAVGGKAATLARLAAAGFPVPAGLVVTSAAWARPADELAAEITAGLQPGGSAAAASSRSGRRRLRRIWPRRPSPGCTRRSSTSPPTR